MTRIAKSLPVPHVPAGGTVSEGDFQEQLRRALNRPGSPLRVWRQNCGEVTTRDRSGRATGVFRAGPMPGAADLSGVANGGRRVEIEVKVKAPHTAEQVAFGQVINGMGGLYLVVRYDAEQTLAENVERGVQDVLAGLSIVPCAAT